MFSFFWVPTPCPKLAAPKTIFHAICDVLYTSTTLEKEPFFLPPGRVGGTERVPIPGAENIDMLKVF